jgi:NDP-sugar pyrophosphorylase family protein
VIGVVPAAGKGTRLGEITRDLPKALVPVAGQPVVARVIDSIVRSGLETIVVVVGHLGRAVEDALRPRYPELDLRFVRQPVQNGTAGALLAAHGIVGDRPFLYAWADLVTSSDACARVLGVHDGTQSVLAVDDTSDPSLGAAVTVVDGWVTDIVEKPPRGAFDTPYNAAGLGVLAAEAWPLLRRVEPSPRGELELTSVLGEMVRSGHRVGAVEIGPVHDMGTVEGLARAEAWVTAQDRGIGQTGRPDRR